MASTKTVLYIDHLDEGLDVSGGPNEISEYGSPDCLNVTFDQFGSVQARNGCTSLNSSAIGTFAIDGMQSFNSSHVVWANGTMYTTVATSFAAVSGTTGTFTTGANMASVVYQGVLFFSEGSTGPWRYETDQTFAKIGIALPAAPTAVSGVATVSGGGPEGGSYYYGVSFVNSHVVEGQIGTSSTVLTIAATATVNLSSIQTAPASTPAAQRFLYRKSTTTGTFRYIGSLANNTATTFTDTVGATTWAVGAAAITDGTGPTFFTTVVEHKDRLFFDDANDKTIVRYTEHRNPYISKAADFINTNKGDGANIVGVAVQDDLVTVGKQKSIWVIKIATPGDDTTWSWAKTPGNVGFVGPKCFVNVPNGIFFLGQRFGKISGFHLLSGLNLTETQDSRLRSDMMSNRIRTDVLSFSSSLWSSAALTLFNNVVYAAVAKSGDTSNAHLYWLDTSRINMEGDVGSWSLWDGVAAKQNCWVVHNGILYGGSSQADGKVRQIETSGYSDDGSAINAYFWTKLLGGEKDIENWIKDFRFVNIWYYRLGSYSMKVNFRIDADTSDGNYFMIDLTPPGALYGVGVYGSSVYGTGSSYAEIMKSFGALLGRRIQLKFSNNNTLAQGFKVNAFKLLMNLRREIKTAA